MKNTNATKTPSVIIDSCVFFGMIKYNNFVEKYGIEHLPELLARQQQKLDNIQKQIEDCFYDDFKEKYKDLTFEQKMEKFKEYRNNKIANLEGDIQGRQALLDGYTINKKGERVPVKLPEKRKEEIKKEIEYYQQQLQIYQKEPEIDFNKYRLNKNSLQNGQLYQMALEGKVKLNLFYVSYNEILNHTLPKEDESWLCFTTNEVGSLTQKCSLITTHSNQTIQDLSDLAAKYRTPVEIEGRKEMAEDINSLGEYGDSLIMAGASMSGIILLTQNEKDFINDKGIKPKNDYIRKNTAEINSIVPYATNALCYTVDEFLNGEYVEPTTKNDVYSLDQINELHQPFTSVYELA